MARPLFLERQEWAFNLSGGNPVIKMIHLEFDPATRVLSLQVIFGRIPPGAGDLADLGESTQQNQTRPPHRRPVKWRFTVHEIIFRLGHLLTDRLYY